MSQYIETSGVPRHDPSSKRRWSVVAGIAVAAALVAAAVGLINAQSEQAVPTAQPSVQAGPSSAELIESGQESLLAQFRAGEHAAQDQRYTPSNAVEVFESAVASTATSEGAASLGLTSRVASSPHEIAEAQLDAVVMSTPASSVPGITQVSIEKAIASQYRAQQLATPEGIAQLRAAELPGLYAAQFVATSEGTVAAGLAARFDLPAFAEASAPSLPASVRGFEYNDDATAYHELGTPVTTTYFGNSGELWPEESEPAAVSGFEYSDEATVYHEFVTPVTTTYFGNSGELWAE